VRLPALRATPSSTTVDDRLRQRVSALQSGLRRALSDSPGHLVRGRIVLRADSLRLPDAVLLDRADLVQPDPDGSFRFDTVSAGEHELRMQSGSRTWRRWIMVLADSTSIEVTLP
jgi:hypothetical protein